MRRSVVWGRLFLFAALLAGFCSTFPCALAEESSRPATLFSAGPGALRLFVENEGQWDGENVRFALMGPGGKVTATESGLAIGMPAGEARIRFGGAKPVSPESVGPGKRLFNFYGGPRDRWREDVPAYEGILYRGLYEGIDLAVTSRGGGLKLEFEVSPGADPGKIVIEVEGAEEIRMDESGCVVARTPAGEVIDQRPVAYQEMESGRKEVAVRFKLCGANAYGFEITGAYDTTQRLMIDPEIKWSTYLGGSDDERGLDVVFDATGNVYLSGNTESADFPTKGESTDRTFGGARHGDCYVAKFDSSGELLWSTFIGGADGEYATSLAVDGSGNVCITGWTQSEDFPAQNAFDATFNGGAIGDAFAAKLGADGKLIWSTYLGGSLYDQAQEIALSPEGDAYICGWTNSSDFPCPNGYDTTYNGGTQADMGGDAFVAKFSSNGELRWATYLGGRGDDLGKGIAWSGPEASSRGEGALTFGARGMQESMVHLTGETGSPDMPAPDGHDTSFNGGQDAFLARFTPDGKLFYATYLGGSAGDVGMSVAAEPSGYCYLAGYTQSPDFPTVGASVAAWGGSRDGFAASFDAQGRLSWSTYLGGKGMEKALGGALDRSGNFYVVGETTSSTWPGVKAPLAEHSAGYDAFVCKLNPAGASLWLAFFGGTSSDYGEGIAVLQEDEICISGDTGSRNFPALGKAPASFGGKRDAFLLRFSAAEGAPAAENAAGK